MNQDKETNLRKKGYSVTNHFCKVSVKGLMSDFLLQSENSKRENFAGPLLKIMRSMRTSNMVDLEFLKTNASLKIMIK